MHTSEHVAFLCSCGQALGHIDGRYLVIYRQAVPLGAAGAPVTKVAQSAPVLCSACQRERWFHPGRTAQPAPIDVNRKLVLTSA